MATAATLLGVLASEGRASTDRVVVPDLIQPSVEELMNVRVVSATKQTRRLADTASAVFVNTPILASARTPGSACNRVGIWDCRWWTLTCWSLGLWGLRRKLPLTLSK